MTTDYQIRRRQGSLKANSRLWTSGQRGCRSGRVHQTKRIDDPRYGRARTYRGFMKRLEMLPIVDGRILAQHHARGRL